MKSEEALEKCFLTLQVTPKHDINNINILIDELPDLFKERKDKFVGIKLQLFLFGNFEKKNRTTGEIEYLNNEPAFTRNRTILREDEVDTVIIQLLTEIKEKIESWDNNEGYFQLVKINHIDFKLREYKPLSGSNYIDLPQWIKNKKACINLKNDDQKCFKYCLLYHKHQNEIKNNPQELYQYKNYTDYDFSNITFPVEIDDINKFCEQNNLSINLYIIDGKNIRPYLTSTRDNRKDNHINLLLIENEDVCGLRPTSSHYVYIKNLSRLVRNQLTKNKNQHYICDRCFYF
jgi:hypothetical protein